MTTSPLHPAPCPTSDSTRTLHSSDPDPRRRFFREAPGVVPSLVNASWRGAVLDPDGFHHAKMPRFLLESIVCAARPDRLLLRTYSPDAAPVSLEPTWEAFRAHRFAKAHWSLEYVLHDASADWAVLLEPELLIIGAAGDLADRIDAELDEHGTSLARITGHYFPPTDPGRPCERHYLHIVTPRGR
jgi:hypothetical protein